MPYPSCLLRPSSLPHFSSSVSLTFTYASLIHTHPHLFILDGLFGPPLYTIVHQIDAAKYLKQSSKQGMLTTANGVMGAGGISGGGASGSGGSGKKGNAVEGWAQNTSKRIFAIEDDESNYDADNEKKGTYNTDTNPIPIFLEHTL